MKKITAVFFDMGNTLIEYPSPSDIYELCKDHARDIGVDKTVLQTIIELFLESRQRGKKTLQEAIMQDAVRQAFARHGIPSDNAAAKHAVRRIFWHLHGAHARIVDGAHDVLNALRESGYAMGIISNTSFPGTLHREDFRRFKLDRYFHTYVWSSDAGIRKPHPAIFQIALRNLQVCAENAVHVGDKINRDVAGALASGIHPIWFDRKKTENRYAGRRIESLSHMIPILDILNTRTPRM